MDFFELQTFELNEVRESKQAQVHIKSVPGRRYQNAAACSGATLALVQPKLREWEEGKEVRMVGPVNRLISKGLEVLVARRSHWQVLTGD